MRQKNSKFNNINIKPTDTKQSRFVVNLKENLEQEEEIKNIELKSKFFISCQSPFVENSNELKTGDSGVVKTQLNIDQKQQKEKCVEKKSSILIDQNKKKFVLLKDYLNLIDQLAFVLLAKFLFELIRKLIILAYKICFRIGLTTIFLIKFSFFIFIVLSKLIITPIKLSIIFIGKSSFYLIVKLGKINYALWLTISRSWQSMIVGSWQLIKQKIYFKTSIIKKTLKQKKLLLYQNIESYVDIFKNVFKNIFLKRFFIKDFLPRPSLAYLQPVGVFALTLLILILPFKVFTYCKTLNDIRAQVLDTSEQAIGQLFSAGKSVSDLNFSQAQENFSKAGDDFLSAQDKLGEINSLLLSLAIIAPNKNLRLAAISKRVLQAGQLSSELGKNLSLVIESSLNNKDKSLKGILDNFRLYGSQTASKALELNNLLTTINKNDLPEQYQQQFVLLKEKTAILSSSLTGLVGLADKLDSFLGTNSNKRYLLVFQNNTELRASGGFIGSFALLDFSNGKLKNIEVPGGGSYDVKAGMLDKIIAPQPLQLIAPQWHFWDANWWADWPTSAKKLMWFYEKSGGPTVDGVISFTPTVIEELLRIIGPIDLTEQYGIIIDADNFWLKTQELAEQKANVTNKPKKIIGDLMNKIIAELPNRITKDNLIPLLKITDQLFSSKQILFNFKDSELQKKTVELGWDGGFKETNKDYLAVINTNIAGGKSDRKIKEVISHQAEIMPDKTIINTVKITRTHTGIKREPFSGVRNVDWMRVYVPQGSELISAQGFETVDSIYFKKPESSWQIDKDISSTENNTQIDESSNTKIYQELNKTVFANWSQVDPGQSITITLKYKLPFKIDKIITPTDQLVTDKIINQVLNLINPAQKQLYPYSLLVQKQPGAGVDQITTNLIVNDFLPVWKYPKGLSVSQTGWQISDNLNSDKFWAVILKEK
ncbi:DUF4012 domain-containing protein [Patescibacteria group bacterium]|nr:DUF4012 domain-containing protein [Patescibacteria group bacterium]